MLSLDNYWVAENSYAVWIVYGNSEHSCAPGADRDDTFYSTESEPGAYHNYSLMFLEWADDSISCHPSP